MTTNIFSFFEKRVGLTPTSFQRALFEQFEQDSGSFDIAGDRAVGKSTGLSCIALYAAMHGLKVCLLTQRHWNATKHPLKGAARITVRSYHETEGLGAFDLLLMDDLDMYEYTPRVIARRRIGVSNV